jgi:translation elongation factor EF-Tu-like GTPase
MASMTVLRLSVEVVPTEEGGRQGPVFDGYRGAISFGEMTDDGIPVVHDTVLAFEGVDQVPPGGSATARAWVVAPEYLPDELGPGAEFTYVEGYRPVVRARVLDVLSDPTEFPVKDLNDAKTRQLDRA